MNRGLRVGFVIFGALLVFGSFPITVTDANGVQQTSSTGENKFLKYLFNKYGSKGVISFEGLEHLMHSLGLGGLDFIPTHTLDEHRPDGFKTEKVVDSFSNTVGDTSDKVTVSFPNIADNEESEPNRPRYETVIINRHTPISTITEPTQHSSHEDSGQNSTNSRQDTIINNSYQISNLNEVRPADVNTDRQQNKTIHFSSDESDDNASSKWHNEVWQEIIFKEIHDPQHRHPRRDDHRKSCLSPMSMVHLILEEPTNTEDFLHANFNYELDPNNRHRRSLPHEHDHEQEDWEQDVEEIIAARIKITPATFKDLCPALLAQIDQRACNQKFQLNDQPHVEKKLFANAWLYATICVTIISVCGLTGVAMVPLAKSVAYDEILRFLVALAIGTLCGDALMHLLPHALVASTNQDGAQESPTGGHNHSDEPVWLCFCAFLSALFMYTLETLLPLLRSPLDDGHHHHHHHGHSHSRVTAVVEPEPQQTRRNTNITDDIEMDLQDSKRKELNTMLEKQKTASKSLSPVAFMVILGDGLHNVTDGLAIGAAFAADPVTGMATSFAILCHELPHELGDFALLLQTGVSIRRALLLNVVSSVLSFLGMIIGLLITGLHESVVRWIYAGTAGTFLYIALVDLIPEMNRSHVEASEGMPKSSKLRAVCSQICGMLMGGLIMLSIALNEDHLRMLFE
ncbi:zinc transporter foi [Malaya genurostris]|uniref:zinc transporter foi n=1 Tax=Malaya genurostris TaxID=325434 RepID=UPI0026F3E624|nr:zinc transporter foi [Malaya genurostris]